MLFYGLRPSEVELLRNSLERCLAVLPPPLSAAATAAGRSSEGADEEEHYLHCPSPTEVLFGGAASRLRMAADALMECVAPTSAALLAAADQKSLASAPPRIGDSQATATSGASTANSSTNPAPTPPPLLAGRTQIASYIIDRTFDDHKVMLRRRLQEAMAELASLRGAGTAGAALEEARLAQRAASEALEASQQQRSDLMAALEHSQTMRREAMLSALAQRRGFMAWHQRILGGLLGNFTLCEAWRDWQLEAFISARAPMSGGDDSSDVSGDEVEEVERDDVVPREVSPPKRLTPSPPLHKATSAPSAQCPPLPAITRPVPASLERKGAANPRRSVAAMPQPPPMDVRAYGEGPSTIAKAIIHPRPSVAAAGGSGGPAGAGRGASIVAKLARQ